MGEERKKMEMSIPDWWVPPIGLIPNRYLDPGAGGLASWASAHWPSFSFFSYFYFSFILFSDLNSYFNFYFVLQVLNLGLFLKSSKYSL
jgi:hypothetical protein